MVLAFRLYGDFLWPPAPELQDADKGRRPGSVEIHYAEKNGSHRAYARWVPKGRETEPHDPPAANAPSAYDKTIVAHTWFADAANACKPIWIDGPAKKNGGVLAAFRGAHLLLQSERKAEAILPTLTLPLVRECKLGTETFHSAFTLTHGKNGDDDHPRFDLDLNLHLPAARTTTDATAVFPLRAVFYPWDGDLVPMGRVGMLVAQGVGVIDKEFRTYPATTSRALGQFGLAACGSQADDFAILCNPATPAQSRPYWPRLNTVAAHVLAKLGLQLVSKPNPADPLEISHAHLRFGQSDRQGLSSATLIYHVAFKAPSGASLKLKGAAYVGDTIDCGDRLHIDVALSWTDIVGNAVHDPASWAFDVDVSLVWPEMAKKTDFAVLDPAALTFGRRVLVETARRATLTRGSLQHVEGAQPVSLLPDLGWPTTGSPPSQIQVYFALYAAAASTVGTDKKGLIVWAMPAPRRFRLTLADPSHLASIEAADVADRNALPLQADLPGFVRTDVGASRIGKATGLRIDLGHDPSWPPRSLEDIESGEPYLASFVVTASLAPQKDMAKLQAWTGRVGGLQFEGRGELTPTEDPDFLRTAGWRLGRTHAEVYPQCLSASLRLSLSVTKVTPVSADVARQDRSGRPAPLLIDLAEAADVTQAGPGRTPFVLRATETFADDRDRLFTASLFDNAQEKDDRDYVILAEEPFSILRFAQVPLGGLGDAGTTEVAVYSSDDRLWQYRLTAQHYHYILPPQVIGESADKPRRLELHDLLSPVGKTIAPPYADEGEKGRADPQKRAARDLKRRAVEFRLTPSTEIWIAPSDVARGYFMPEQASYEIFRQRGEYGLGAALAGLRGEFLYGLTVGLDVSKENSIARHARVAEIGALTGNVIGPARELHADRAVSARWNALRPVMARRPERLEIWARDPDSPVDFAPARFADGVSFVLRDSALHRAPLPVAELEEEEEPPVGEAGKPRFHPHGLSGGALWPVESLNLLTILRGNPTSDGGALENVALSPLGGDATQKAQFLGGKVAILSETRGGQVERHKVEVVGRIGALWHRAKHVVVYERTVNPSAQFAPKAEGDPRTRSRRPILRKVREYIELIQPERAYPDFPQALARSTGFLERVRFNSKVINVDSVWSREVGTSAWCIPLWNRQSARERPQVYPMPDIAFVTVAEGEGAAPVVAQECLDPDQLWFFADFAEKTSDTDLWPAQVGIDFANLPMAQVMALIVDEPSRARPGEIDGSEGRRPAVTRFLPGARRFTWRLAPAARKTAINAGRATKPVYVGLDSVSFMRAVFDKAAADTFTPLGKLLKATQGLDAVVTGDPWTNGGGASGALAEFDIIAKALRTAAAADNKKNFEAALKALNDAWPNGTGTLEEAIESDIIDKADQLKEKLTGLTGHLDAGKLGPLKPRCDQLKADAVGLLQRKALLVKTVLQEWQQDAVLSLKQPEIPTKADAIKALCDAAESALRPIFAEASQDVGNLGAGIETARAILQAVEWDIEALFDEALRRVEQVEASYERDKPWSPERRRALSADLRACFDSVARDVGNATLEARQRLAAEIDDLGQAMAAQLGRLLGGIAKEQSNAIGELASLNAFLRSSLEPLTLLLDRLAPGEAGKQGLLDRVIARVAAVRSDVERDVPDEPENLKKNVLAALDKLEDALEIAKIKCGLIRSTLDTATDVTFEALPGLVQEVGEVATSLLISAVDALKDIGTQAEALAEAKFVELSKALAGLWRPLEQDWKNLADWVDQRLAAVAAAVADVDVFVVDLTTRARAFGTDARDEVRALHGRIDGLAADTVAVVKDLSKFLAPDNLLRPIVIDQGVEPALKAILLAIPDDLASDFDRKRHEIGRLIQGLADRVDELLARLEDSALAGADEISRLCEQLANGVDDAKRLIETLIGQASKFIEDKLKSARNELDKALQNLPADLTTLVSRLDAFDRAVRGLHNDVLRAGETAQMYGDRVLDAAGRLGSGGLMAAPSNILKLYSAVSSAPELAGLKSDIERIRSGFDELSDIIETTPAGAMFNRLGDELKALGLSIPFDRIGDRLLPADLSGLDIGKVFRNFGGAKLDKLFRGYKLPAGVRDAVRISHDFDKKQARAWVQVDIDAPMPGRRSLFSIGPLSCDFLDLRLTGQVRLEASKDSDRITQTGYGRLGTTLDMVVSGQSMVRFEKFALNFTKEDGLKIEFDPKNIRLNPAFEFVQEALAGLFPDAIGPLTVIKEKGIPIGVEHEYALPVISMNAVTSGISNISIENRFRLVAYPDFVISDRFGLCRPERPFIFSIFILGGCGYVQIEAEYRPFDSELTVTVDASAGASALLGFSVGPFSGQVFIALSGVLSYRKTLGRPGGGLSVSCTLVIAGNVDVMGIVTIGIYLLLRMTYRDTGEVNADGTLAVTIRISRFFKIRARAQVTYRLRNGRGQVQSSASADAQIEDQQVAKGIAAAKKLGKAVG